MHIIYKSDVNNISVLIYTTTVILRNKKKYICLIYVTITLLTNYKA